MRKLKHIKRIDELLDSIGKSRASGEYRVIWANGVLMYEPKQEELLHLFTQRPVSMKVNEKEKTVKLMPMDDWSDVKIILRVQQALKDLIRDNSITEDWTVEIGTKGNVARSFGSNKVGDLIKYDAKWQKSIPYIFHGTTTWHLPEIKKNGLQPRSKTDFDPNWDRHYTEESPEQIYLTIDFERAMYYANHAVNFLKGQGIEASPVVLEIRDMPTKDLVMDDDFKNNQGIMHLLMAMSGSTPKDTYQRSLRGSGQVAHKGGIDPSMIVAKWENGEDRKNF
jgi:hypothetical protein